jgi:hypothetical protein
VARWQQAIADGLTTEQAARANGVPSNVVSLREACHAAILAAHKLSAKTWTTALVRAVERLRLDYPL